MFSNLIGIDPDTPIYRIFKYKHLRDALTSRELTLSSPSKWDDPFENILVKMQLEYIDESGRKAQLCLDSKRDAVYCQCWSLLSESDAMWRIYSSLKKDNCGLHDDSENEGILVKTTARKLIDMLGKEKPDFFPENCFLGRVEYLDKSIALNQMETEVRCYRSEAYSGGKGHARSLLIKSMPFKHEEEVRLIVVSPDGGDGISFDPNALFDEIVLDPRLHVDRVSKRRVELRELGYMGSVERSDLYQGELYLIVCH